MCAVRKVAVLALLAVFAAVLGALRPGLPAERSEASFPVGGIAALPSALPALPIIPGPGGTVALPGMAQTLPGMAPASGPGSFVLVSAFCEGASCPLLPRTQAVAPVEFTMSKVFPPGGTVAATFTANGAQRLLCVDDTTCDLSDGLAEGSVMQHVAVGLTGGGENEVISVTACHSTGDCRSVLVMFVETILALGLPAGIAEATAENPTIISYRCNDVGLYTADADHTFVTGGTAPVSFEEVFNWFYGGPNVGSVFLRNPTFGALPMPDIPFYSCGGDTSSPVDDRVNFETDLGMFTVEFVGDGAGTLAGGGILFRPFGTISTGCDVGDSVDILDHPGPVLDTRGTAMTLGPDIPDAWCDLDFAPNGLVTYILMGTGQRGVATVTGQQSGGGGVLRTAYPSLTGLAALGFVVEAPDVIGLEGGTFKLALIDPDLRFLGGQTVQCTAEPKDAVLRITPQTGTTGGLDSEDPGQVLFTLYPTLSAVEAGVDVTITCALDSNPDVFASIPARIGEPAETVDLLPDCNPIASTWPDDTPIETVAEAVLPAEALDAIWKLDPESGMWQGYAPAAPEEASDLAFVNELEAILICMNASGTISRPEM